MKSGKGWNGKATAKMAINKETVKKRQKNHN